MGIPAHQVREMRERLERNKARGLNKEETADVPDDLAKEEGELQKKIIQDAQDRGWWVLYSQFGVPTTTPKGTPDLFVFADGAQLFIIEAKALKRKLRPEQIGVKVKLETLGFTVHVVRAYSEWLDLVNLSY